MTLPTTRIDTLTPGHDPSALCSPSDSSTQQILLSDFLQWSTNQEQDPDPTPTTPPRRMMGVPLPMNGHSGSSGSTAPSLESPSDTTSASREVSFFTAPPKGLANAFPPPLTLPPANPPVQVQYRPNPLHPHPQRGFPGPEELSNFSLVNLSNEGLINSGDGEDLPMLRRKSRSRSQSSGGGRGQGQGQQNPIQSQQPKSQAFYHHHNGTGNGIGVGARVGKKGKRYSSSSSEDDSDTGFLVRSGENFLKANGSVVRTETEQKPFPSYPYQGGPTARKKFRRRKNSARSTKGPRPQNSEEPSFYSCCFDEEPEGRRSAASSLTGKYLRFSCAIIIIIFITTFVSILVSMQRKVDLLSAEVNQFKSAGSASLSASTAPVKNPPPSPANSTVSHDLDQLNLTISSLSQKYADLSARLSAVEKQPSIDELRKDLAHLGSEMKGSIEEIQKDLNNVKQKIQENKNRTHGQGQPPSGAGAEQGDKKSADESGNKAMSV